MDSNARPKMSMSNRAKQFAPFDALKGFQEALRKKEKMPVPKKELAEEKAEEINEKLKQLTTWKLITVVYYNDGEYIQLTGTVVKIEKNKRYLQMAETIIPFDDISDIID